MTVHHTLSHLQAVMVHTLTVHHIITFTGSDGGNVTGDHTLHGDMPHPANTTSYHVCTVLPRRYRAWGLGIEIHQAFALK